MARKIRNHKEIFDRGIWWEKIEELKEIHSPDNIRGELLSLLKKAYGQGFDEIKKRCEKGIKGTSLSKAQSFLTDEIVKILYNVTIDYIYKISNPTKSERISLIAVGGYGRYEMAPYSDLDLLFLMPYKQTPWGEQVVEYMLYMLWDMGLIVGQSVRTINDTIRLSKKDHVINTTVLEARFIWGDEELFDELIRRYRKEIVQGNEIEFTEGKLRERDVRHKKLGDTRYVVEPNLKDGKGGLRDLHTLFWIAKFTYDIQKIVAMVQEGVFSLDEYKEFRRAQEFLWTVRFHLHYLAGRAEERITFDVQTTLSKKLGYKDRTGVLAVERFMKHYFWHAKNIGDLTRIFCAFLEDANKKKPLFSLQNFGLRQRKRDGFPIEGNRISVKDSSIFTDDPLNMIRIFYIAQKNEFDIHPKALRFIRQSLRLINAKLRNNKMANRLFIRMLRHKSGPGFILRLMNEAGVLGRFVPDFGRVVAQMQYDMYHTYTVDEHTIRALELLSEVERGILAEDHPLANKIIHKIISRKVLYVAVFLHDIAKGRKGDHSVLGAEVARKLCPRFGLSAAETEMVIWLVRHHLLMVQSSFKRDLNDPKTISDFANAVQSPERLRLLLVLTVVDIRAVGPKVWNGWKGQLLRELYYRSEEFLLGGQIEGDNELRIGHLKAEVRAFLDDWSSQDFVIFERRFFASYWLALPPEKHVKNARLIREADKAQKEITIDIQSDEFQSITELTVYTVDHHGLFAELTGAIALSGASIQHAKVFTTKDGMVLDTFWIQKSDGSLYDDPKKHDLLKKNIQRIINRELSSVDVLGKIRKKPLNKKSISKVEPVVLVDNNASNSYTVVEINGFDRTGHLFDLSRVLVDLDLIIASAHIATYGERAITVFFVKDASGHKITHSIKIQKIKETLMKILIKAIK